MFSQTSTTNRRQFLERSMMGFGSAFLLPSLLASCTDHIVPPTNPGTPIVIQPLGLGEYSSLPQAVMNNKPANNQPALFITAASRTRLRNSHINFNLLYSFIICRFDGKLTRI